MKIICFMIVFITLKNNSIKISSFVKKNWNFYLISQCLYKPISTSISRYEVTNNCNTFNLEKRSSALTSDTSLFAYSRLKFRLNF